MEEKTLALKCYLGTKSDLLVTRYIRKEGLEKKFFREEMFALYKVMVGDQIQLESVKTEGHFLHCSLLSFGAEETPDRLTSMEEGRCKTFNSLIH